MESSKAYTISNMPQKKNMSVEEFRVYMGIGRATAYELVNSDGFPSFRIGKKILINVDALEEWIKNNIQKRWEQE